MALPTDLELLNNDSNDDGDGQYSFISREKHAAYIDEYFVIAWDDGDNKHHEGIWAKYDKDSEKEQMKEIANDSDNTNIQIVRRFKGIAI